MNEKVCGLLLGAFNPSYALIKLIEAAICPLKCVSCGFIKDGVGRWYYERAKVHKLIREKVTDEYCNSYQQWGIGREICRIPLFCQGNLRVL